MAVNKVCINGETVLDLSGDSVTPETLIAGATAHNAAGAQIIGTANPGGGGGGLLSVSAMYEIIKAQGTAFPETIESPFPTPEGASVLYTGFKDARGNVAVYVSRIYSVLAILNTSGSVSNTGGFWNGTWSAGDDGNPVVENVELYLPFESVSEVGVIINGIDPEVTGLYMNAATEGYYLFL